MIIPKDKIICTSENSYGEITEARPEMKMIKITLKIWVREDEVENIQTDKDCVLVEKT